MSVENRIDSVSRPNIQRASAEPLVQRTAEGAIVTGLEKSMALSQLGSARESAGRSSDHGGSVQRIAATVNPDQQSLSFADLIDVINPLQHIPLVSSAYRAITGDEISAPAQVAGSTLFFGPIGGATAIANLAVEEISGKSVGGHVVSLLTGGTLETDDSDSIETADAEISGQPGSPGDFSVASLAPSATALPAADEPLSPNQPFTFNSAPPPAIAGASRAIGFAGSPEPVALDSLPADILSALYSGQSVRANGLKDAAAPGAEAAPATQQSAANYAQTVDAAPRWSLWSSPDDTLAAPKSAPAAYGGVIPDVTSAPGSIADQSGWFATAMPEVLARYQDSANLQRQAARPFLDVSQ